MINYQYFDLFQQGSIDKQWKIEYDGGTITNSELFSQSIEIKESLCSDSELRFGSCETSSLKFKIANVVQPLIGKWVTVSVVVDHHEEEPLLIGRYKVDSDKLTSDRMHREIIAYDAMYDIIHADVAAWYNSMFPKAENQEKEKPVPLKEFRENFIRHFGLEEVVPEGGLVNDDMEVEKTIAIIASETSGSDTSQVSIIGETLSGLDVITSICEINGCFGHIGRDGKFHYIYLQQGIQGLYPSDNLYPSNTLFPRESKGKRIGGGTYIDIQWENYDVKGISKLQIRQEENDIGLIYGTGDNCYIIQGNFLVFGKSSKELKVIAEKIYGRIYGITYTPLISCEASGNPCLEVGDAVRMSTKYRIVETYILDRTLKGVQALRDIYKANGTEEYSSKVNSVHSSILQIQGMANILERTIEMTRLQMINIEAGLSTEIKVTAAGLLAEVSAHYETITDAYAKYTDIQSSITLQSGRITSEIERATTTEEFLRGQISTTQEEFTSKIEQTESKINLSVSKSIEESSSRTKEYADAQIKLATDNINLSISQTLKNYSTTEQMTSAINIATNSIDLSISQRFEKTLKNYSTTEQVNSAIKIATDSIDLSVNNKITETRKYADTVASNVQNTVSSETDRKLLSYSTTAQMNSAIKVATDKIDLSVSSSVSEVRTYAETLADDTKEAVDTKLTNYSTTTQMNAAIKLSESSIKSTVSATYETKSDAESSYRSLNSSISQTASEISTKVSKDGIISSINQTAESVKINASKISLNGVVTANNYFKINTDGSMECNQAAIKNATITNGTITSASISRGTIDNAAITNGTITNASISSGSITSASIQSGTVYNAAITNGTIENATCTNLDVQSGKIGSFVITSDAIDGSSISSGGYAIVGMKNAHYAFSAGRVSPSGERALSFSVSHDGQVQCREISCNDAVFVSSIGGIGGAGCININYANSFIGDIKAFNDALEVLSSKDLALHAGANNNFIHLYNNTKYYGTFAAASARKYKKNITEITAELADKITELVPVEFDYAETGRHAAGLIADDTYPVLKQVVGLKDGEPDNIDYIQLIPYIIKKIKNLEERIG